jgi:hypothetical protein
MFKGFNENLKKALEEKNQSTNKFTFSFADLELTEKNGDRRKCRLLSDELSKKLHEIFSKGKSGYIPPIKFIDFELKNRNIDFYGIFLEDCLLPLCDYIWWLKLSKKNIQENSEILSNGTLKFNFLADSDAGAGVFMAEIGKYFGNYYSNYKNKEDDFIRREASQTSRARSSSLTQIQNTIKNGNIDLDELMEYGDDYRDSYIHNKPNDCLHCPVIEPDNVKEYYKIHINKCLWRSDRINEFKDKLISLIQRKITEFNTYKEEYIEEVIETAHEQGLTETELNNTRPGWPDYLRQLTNREQLNEYFFNQLKVDIENLVAAKNEPKEEKQEAEEKVKEEAKKKQEQLKKEQAEKKAQAQKQEAERIKREQEQAQKDEERLKKEFEETKQKEENYWYWKHLEEAAKQKEQEQINQERQRLEKEKEQATQPEEKDRLEKQQAELAQREKALEKEQEEEDQNENSNSQILKKFASIPNFDSKEKIEALINPVKNNPNFLQNLKDHNIPNSVALIIDKSPREIIITIKRFEYDQEKEKAIRAYYHLNSNDPLTDNQINDYLYLEAIGSITSSPSENPSNENNLLIPLILGGGLLLTLLGVIAVIRIRLKRKRK